jgi:hypothetical protein
VAAKDRRLYARIDIGFDEHDKIFPLSDAAFRALVEATLYARRQLTDGFLAERLAVKRWGVEVLEELSTNDPARPSLVRVEGGWQIHDFAEHQTTNADIEAKRESGTKGAAKRWGARANGEPMAPVIAPAMGNPMRFDGGTLAKTETETDTKTEVKPSSSEVAHAPIRHDVEQLLDLLDSLIVSNGSKKPVRNKANRDAARLLLDKDGRTFNQVEAAIRWSQNNQFWRGNILSMSKLREKYDQLRLAAERERSEPGRKLTNAEIAMQRMAARGEQHEIE